MKETQRAVIVLLLLRASGTKASDFTSGKIGLHSRPVLCMFVHVGRRGPQHFEASIRLYTFSERTRPQSESLPYACDWRAPVVAKQSCSSCAK